MEKLRVNKTLLPSLQRILEVVGEQIKIARLRRKLSQHMVAARAGISRYTIERIETGSPSVSLGAYAQVLLVLGLEKDMLLLANEDKVGRKIQDLGLVVKKRAPKTAPKEK
ncbi:MAG: helix-turn-helix domain-containing protein [Puniceicoccales bacterium]|jgi:transcriptional regulator with XRE-family HTH domain|nr:helix-turn-helix domain-containing protein [Puniceicoccales bacterium]